MGVAVGVAVGVGVGVGVEVGVGVAVGVTVGVGVGVATGTIVVFCKTVTAASNKFVTTISGLPSPFKSPAAMNAG